jgi:recombinational DNA repair ATPase RecF
MVVTLIKKAMKPHVIDRLQSLEQKIELLMRKGEFAMSYEALDHETWLYALDGQLVEIVYSIVFNRIEEIRVLEDPKKLDRYLDNIDITELVS